MSAAWNLLVVAAVVVAISPVVYSAWTWRRAARGAPAGVESDHGHTQPCRPGLSELTAQLPVVVQTPGRGAGGYRLPAGEVVRMGRR